MKLKFEPIIYIYKKYNCQLESQFMLITNIHRNIFRKNLKKINKYGKSARFILELIC